MRFRILAACLAAWHVAAIAAPADPAAAAARAQTVCATCHGGSGVSTTPITPSLAGQPEGFLQWQLVYFRSATRKNPIMQPMSTMLSDDDIRNLAAYYAALPGPSPADNGPAEAAMYSVGQRIAQQNHCASCHKDTYVGAQAAARTAGQREDYLLFALREFKAGTRTGGGVAAMADVVYPLSDDELRALAHYMSHLAAP
jgi:cytochrome c553